MSEFPFFFVIFLFFRHLLQLEITVSSNESSQPENLIFNSFSEAVDGVDGVMDNEALKFSLLTNCMNDKVSTFESKNIEIM